jgi:hypothetical protein
MNAIPAHFQSGEYVPRRRGERGAPRVVLSFRRELLTVDTGKIRRKALLSYHRAEKTLHADKERLSRYRAHDIPGFRAWFHRTFGELLTRVREALLKIDESRALFAEMEWLAERDGLSESAAYRKVMWRRAHPAEAEKEDRQFEETMKAQAAKHDLRDENEDEDFDEFDPFGGDFEDADGEEEEKDEDRLRDLFEELTGIRMPRPRSKRTACQKPAKGTVRELYRKIVRNLHPDHHGQMSEARRELWHEAQDAYRRRDADALHGILVRCSDGTAGIGPHSPVSLIQRLTLQLKKAARSVRSELRRARSDPAWNYEQKTGDPRFIGAIRRGLQQDLAAAEYDLACLKRRLIQIERRSNRPTPPPRRGRSVRMADPDGAMELPF